jgi:hypothetical protein
MLKFYSNRQLSDRLGLPLSRWKRWSREFLPPDPLGGLQSGYARQYNIRDAFTVYFAGYLVSKKGFSIPEARQVLNDLNGWVRHYVVEPFSKDYHGGAGHSDDGFPQYELHIQNVQSGRPLAFSYRIRTFVRREALGADSHSLWQETYREQVLKPGDPVVGGGYPACARRVDLTRLAGHFFERI